METTETTVRLPRLAGAQRLWSGARTMLALLGLAVLAGMGFERLSAFLSPRTRVALAAIAGGLLVAEFAAIPLGTVPYHVEIPAIDRWLAGRPTPFVVAELPLADPANLGARERRHTEYMLHSMAHWQKTVEGYSGLRPPLHEALYAQLQRFPDERSLRGLAQLEIGRASCRERVYVLV